jgi:hypothetical protein
MAKIQKSTDSSSLAEVVDRILDKGIVIDVWAKVSLVGIELLSVEARVVIASVETYLKYAEAISVPRRGSRSGPQQGGCSASRRVKATQQTHFYRTDMKRTMPVRTRRAGIRG